jgi:acetyl-CoA carboxylase biotin carboxyl carrier protein
MTLDEIRELIQLVSETGVAELEVQRGENRVRIRRTTGETHELSVAASANAAPPAAARNAPAAPGPSVSKAAARPEPAGPAAEDDLVYVRSPIVGTFYEASSPGAPPFVQVGDVVQPGKVLCIIESMKLMNEIEAETDGVVDRQLVDNGQPVEYGEALFAIRPI